MRTTVEAPCVNGFHEYFAVLPTKGKVSQAVTNFFTAMDHAAYARMLQMDSGGTEEIRQHAFIATILLLPHNDDTIAFYEEAARIVNAFVMRDPTPLRRVFRSYADALGHQINIDLTSFNNGFISESPEQMRRYHEHVRGFAFHEEIASQKTAHTKLTPAQFVLLSRYRNRNNHFRRIGTR